MLHVTREVPRAEPSPSGYTPCVMLDGGRRSWRNSPRDGAVTPPPLPTVLAHRADRSRGAFAVQPSESWNCSPHPPPGGENRRQSAAPAVQPGDRGSRLRDRRVTRPVREGSWPSVCNYVPVSIGHEARIPLGGRLAKICLGKQSQFRRPLLRRTASTELERYCDMGTLNNQCYPYIESQTCKSRPSRSSVSWR